MNFVLTVDFVCGVYVGRCIVEKNVFLVNSDSDHKHLLVEVVAVVLGYPCRSLSSQCAHPKAFTDKQSSTGAGYDAFIKFVDNHPSLQVALLENVQGMMQTRKQFNDERPIDIQNQAMRKRGFKVAFNVMLNSASFGLAQSRTRCYALYIREVNCKNLGPCFCFVWVAGLTLHSISNQFSIQFAFVPSLSLSRA